MGISDADTAQSPRYFLSVCKKTAYVAIACRNHISDAVGLIRPPALAVVTGFWSKQSLHRTR